MSLHKTAVISDTHGILRPEVLEILRTAELILHGGDLASRKTLDELQKTARVIAVRGNCDRDWAEDLPREVFFDLYGRKVYMIHDKKQRSAKAEEADLVICGHSHKYEERKEDGRIWLNPGSCGPRRFGRPLTMALLEYADETGSLRIKKIELLSEKGQDAGTDLLRPELGTGELQKIIVLAVGDLKKGKSAESIARTRKISVELAEQICQIYFTHPGIDVQGVLNRIEIAGR